VVFWRQQCQRCRRRTVSAMPFVGGGHLWIMLVLLAILALAVWGLVWAVRPKQPPPPPRYGPPPPGHPLPPPT
jgi:hypothetical protein